MDKKIALVTCYFQKNYGSQLQAYATQMALDKLGLDNETIKIDGLLPDINKAKYRYFLSRIFDLNTIKDKMATVRKIVAKLIYPDYANNLAKRYSKFEEFANAKFRLSERYSSKIELSQNAERYSAVIVGSDQLWLPSNIAADYYTLNWVPDRVCKIALSTSFGISSLPTKYGILARRFLSRLDYVSVREVSGQKIIKQWADREAPVVCDPTILFDSNEWNSSLNINDPGNRFANGEKYLFVYFLGNNPWERDFVRKVRSITGYKIVQIAHSDEYVKSDVGFADYTPYDVGPKEFCELIKDAEFIFTDSFHCSVFSMLYSKQFYTFPRYSDDGPTSTNGRLYSLLSLLHLESRIITKKASVSFDFVNAQNNLIKYDETLRLLQIMRDSTWNWFTGCLREKAIL